MAAGFATVVLVGAVVWVRVLSVPAVETATVEPSELRARAFGTGTVEARVYVEVGSKIMTTANGRVMVVAAQPDDLEILGRRYRRATEPATGQGRPRAHRPHRDQRQ